MQSRSGSESSASTSDESHTDRAKASTLSSVIFIKRPEKKTIVDTAATRKKEVASVVIIQRPKQKKEIEHTVTKEQASSEKKRKVSETGETEGELQDGYRVKPSVEPRSNPMTAQGGKSTCSLATENKTKDNIATDLSVNESGKTRVIKINRSIFKESRVNSSSEECVGSNAKPRQRHWSSSSETKTTPQSDSVSGHSDQDGDLALNLNERLPASHNDRRVGFSKQTDSLNDEASTSFSLENQGKPSEIESKRTVTLPKQSDVTSTTQHTRPIKKLRLASTCNSLTDQTHSGPSVKIDRTFTKASSLVLPEKTEQCKSLVTVKTECKNVPLVNLPSDAPLQTCNQLDRGNQNRSHTKRISSISGRSSKDQDSDKAHNEKKKKQEKRPISPVLFPTHSSSSKSHKHYAKERTKSKMTKRDISSSPVYSEEQNQEEMKEERSRKMTSVLTRPDSKRQSRKRRFREEKRDRTEKNPHSRTKQQRRESSLSPDRRSSNRSRSSGSLYSDDYSTPLRQRLSLSSGSSTPLSDDYSTPRKRRGSSRYVPVSVSPCDRSKPGWLDNHEQYKSLCKVPRPYDVLLVGDSIIKGLARYSNVWRKYLAPLNALNFGIGGDQTQHVLWRLQNGELECYPRVVVVHCGTNNINKDSAEDIVQGILAIVNYIREKRADAKVIVVGLLPRDYYPDTFRREKIESVNSQLEEQISFSDELQEEPVWFLRPEDDWVDEEGRLKKDLYYSDWLHLAELGDEKLARVISDCARELLEEGSSD